MKRQLVVDFETASACDLKASGAVAYAQHPTTEILCLCWRTIDGRTIAYWCPGHALCDLSAFVNDPEVVWIAHNAGFEKAIWRFKMMPEWGVPDIPNERWHDTQAVCAMKGIPLKLERALPALHLPYSKDMEGNRLTLSLSKPDRKGYYDRSPETMARVIQYCHSDCEGEAILHKRVKWLSNEERNVWLLDQKINERGLRLDMDYVHAAQQIVAEASAPLVEEFRLLTGVNPTQGAKFQTWCASNGLAVPDLQKLTVTSILGSDEHGDDSEVDWDLVATDLNPCVERALRIKQLVSSTSISKLNRMQACVADDGRGHGFTQYHGAGTGRWAGRLLQPHNFPRESVKVDKEIVEPQVLVDAILTGDWKYVGTLYGNAVSAVVRSLRHAILAASGHTLLVGDFAGIEARLVLALAGQIDKINIIEERGSSFLYCDMAEAIYGFPVDKHNDVAQYTIGKCTVLGAGFQMGWKKFKARYAKHMPDEFCEKVISTFRKEWAPQVPKAWYGLEAAAVEACHSGQSHEAYGVQFKLEDGWLTARLPSGRKLWYFGPKTWTKPVPWDPDVLRQGYSYMASKQGQWILVDAYGGLITENVIQALARDLMVHAMLLCEQEGLPVVLTVHDEIVTEPESWNADPKMLEQIMCDRPAWAKAIHVPIAAECWVGERYHK